MPGPLIVRGVRNNNPGNIEYNPAWQGLKSSRTDDRFCEFQTMAFGFRALAVTLCTYQDKYQIDTVEKAITRWAPPNENNTTAYINDVCAKAKLKPDEKVNFHDFNDAAPIINAIAEHENGVTFNRNDLVQGCIRAGLENCPRGVAGSVGRVVGTAVVAGGTYAANNPDVLTSAYNSVKPIVDAGPHFVQGAFWVAVLIAGGLLVIGEIRKMRKS